MTLLFRSFSAVRFHSTIRHTRTIPLTYIYYRSCSVSSPTVSVVNGHSLEISSLFVLSKSALASFKRSTNSLLSDPYSASAWVAFGVWLLRPLSKISLWKRVGSPVDFYRRGMPLDISSRLWTTCLLCLKSSRDGGPCSGFLRVSRCLPRRLGRCYLRARFSWELKQRRLREDIQQHRRRRFSWRRRGRCWGSIGRFVSMLCCWWRVSYGVVFFSSITALLFLSRYLYSDDVIFWTSERFVLTQSFRFQFPLPWIAGNYPFLAQPHISGIYNVPTFWNLPFHKRISIPRTSQSPKECRHTARLLRPSLGTVYVIVHWFNLLSNCVLLLGRYRVSSNVLSSYFR